MKTLILDGVAGALNACGRTVVISYDTCASSMGKICGLVKKSPGSMGKVCDLTKKASGATKKLFGSLQRETARDVSERPSQKTWVEEASQELPLKPKKTTGTSVPVPPAKKAEPKTISSKTIEVSEPLPPADTKLISEERLKKMVKPQLISLCKRLNIECDYTETKAQIITKILKRK